jgi:proline dehydrogenase
VTVTSAVRRRATRRYVAGDDLSDAVTREEKLRESGVGTIIAYWNAASEDPDAVADRYSAALDALAGRPEVQLACKPPALDLDPHRTDALAERARRAGVPLHFDSLGPESATASLELTVSAGAGATLPGRWPRSVTDADSLASTGLPVRVVKGQWPDPEAPRHDPGDGFLAVVDRLAGRTARVEVATHDGKLAAAALRRLSDAGTPCELQLLLGLPAAASLAAARDAEVGVRVYVPYGAAFLPYALRGAAQHPSIVFRLGADLLRRSSRAAF